MTEDETVRKGTIYLFVAAGFALGGLSHLFGDVLGADDFEPIEPFWPVVEEPIAIDLAHFASPWLNGGMLIVAAVLHLVVVGSGLFPIEHRFRRWRVELLPDESAR